MIYLKYLVQTLIFAIITTNHAFATPSVQLLCERNRTETNWVDYRITLKNISSENIHNPKIHYYAANNDVIIDIDYITDRYFVIPSVTNVHESADIEFDIQGSIAPQQLININFRIHRQNWTPIDFAKDWSYVKYARVALPNYFMTVYDDSHKLLWGDDPLHGNYNTGDVVTWSDRGKNTAVTRYNGSNEALPAGRFWLFKDTPLSPKERDLLAQRGISKLSIGRSRGKIVAVFKSNTLVRKKMLDSLIAGFYNAIPVADTVPVAIDLTDEDLYTEKSVCNAGQCHKEVELRPEFNMEISCWNDVDVNNCVSTIRNCGGQDIGVARGFIVATIAKDSLQCLSRNRDIEAINTVREHTLTNNKGREAVNIDGLQNSEEWINALKKDSADLDWLKGVEYSGDSILVGIYDTGIDFNHPDFNEYDSHGQKQARIMQKYEYYGKYYNEALRGMNLKSKEPHGTYVAGYAGGNGNKSNFKYRGIAPKIHFYPGKPYTIVNQIGHVVSHSHTNDAGWYQKQDFLIDKAIFGNWKSNCTRFNDYDSTISFATCIEGDTLVKTVVYSAGNNGKESNAGYTRGYHSIMTNAKNPIIVGNITAEEKIRAFSSSMGPTLDGRIKPDVMAPGVSSLISIDEKHPFEIQIDYIKFYKENESTPYLNIDFDKNNIKSTEDNYFTSCETQILADNNKVLACNASDLDSIVKRRRPQLYFSWTLDNKIDISPSDSIEVRYKKVSEPPKLDHVFGTILFGTCNQNSPITMKSPKVPVIWPLSNNFQTVGFKMINIEKNTTACRIRVDFNFERGTITPDICHRDSCGYIYQGDGGTSQATPFVSGVVALMYQKFHKQTNAPLDKHSMRNATTKALLIHTAVDMEDSEEAHFASNPDLDRAHNDEKFHFTPYGKGPDFATGWGHINGKAALDLISNYNKKTKEFPKFKEFEIGNSFEKRWSINVDSIRQHLRTTLVWDDAPGYLEATVEEYITQDSKEPKLVNDLDMYLISPSGKYYYPWRLKPLPTDFLDSLESGLENILESDVDTAQNNCTSQNKLDYDCFDHLNNVEVVDVENPELGKWQVVVFGRSITEFNNESNNAQVASLVSDLDLKPDNKLGSTYSCAVVNGYDPQADYSCTQPLGNNMIYYVTFHDSTSLGDGDDIVLTNAEGKNIGMFVGNELAGKTIKVKSNKLTVTLHSDNDKSQGWGFKITSIRSVNHAILKMPFEAIKKKRRTP